MDDAFAWQPVRPRMSRWAFFGTWIASAIALNVAAWILPGVSLYHDVYGSLAVVALIAGLNALLAPLVAALRLPFAVAINFILSLLLGASIVSLAAALDPELLRVDNYL